jgi:hypothetical protein
MSINPLALFSDHNFIIFIGLFTHRKRQREEKNIRNPTSSLEILFINDRKIFISKHEKT